MATATPKKLWDPALLGNSVSTYYTVPAATTTYIEPGGIIVANPDTVDRTFTVYVIKSGDTAADKYAIAKGVTIPAGDEVPANVGPLVMNTGDFIQMLADTANKITAHGAGTEVA